MPKVKNKQQLETLDKAAGFQISAAPKIQSKFLKERKQKEKTYHTKTFNLFHMVKGAVIEDDIVIKKSITPALNPVAHQRSEIKDLLGKTFDVVTTNLDTNKYKSFINKTTQVQKDTKRGYSDFIKALQQQMRPAPVVPPTPPQPHPMAGIHPSHQALLGRARNSDLSAMHDPQAHVIRDAQGMTPLHHLAMRGHTEILQHEHISEPTDKLNRTPLHYLAQQNKTDVINHPQAATQRDTLGKTPLHYLAQAGNKAVLGHPDVAKVKDFNGKTPLHSLAYHKDSAVTSHPDFTTVKDDKGRTPADIYNGIQKALLLTRAFMGEVFTNLNKGGYGSGKRQLTAINYNRLLQAQRHAEGIKPALRDKATHEIHPANWDEYAHEDIKERVLGNRWAGKDTHEEGFVDHKHNFINRSEANKRYGIGTSIDLLTMKSFLDMALKKSDPVKKTYTVNGVDIAIEWPKGTRRSYFNRKTKKRETGKPMAADYGYVPNTTSMDGEEIDVYVGPNKISDRVFLLMQKPVPGEIHKDPKTGALVPTTEPEEKYMLGFKTASESAKAYKNSMPPDWLLSVQEIKWGDFEKRIKECAHDGHKTSSESDIKKSLKLDGKESKTSAAERAKNVGLIDLPPGIMGTNCGNCKFFKSIVKTDGDGYCYHKLVEQRVTNRKCCDYWYHEGTGLPPNTTMEEYNLAKAISPVNNGQMPGYNSWNSAQKRAKQVKANRKIGKAGVLGQVTKGDLSTMPQMSAGQSRQGAGQSYYSEMSGMSDTLKAFTGPAYFKTPQPIPKAPVFKKSGPFGTPPFDEPNDAARTYWEDAKYDRRPHRERDGKINPKLEKLFRKIGDVQKAIKQMQRNNPDLVIEI